MGRKASVLWFVWLAVAGFLAWSAVAQARGDMAAGPCTGTRSATATHVHLQPSLFNDASWAEFTIDEPANHLVVCQDGEAMSYRVLDRQPRYVRMRIGNRWVVQHFLQMDLDIYADAERWQVLFDNS